MIKNKASWTAQMTAVFRAVESMRPVNQRLLVDKYAVEFLKPSIRLLLKNRLMAHFILWFMVDRRFPGATDTIVSRIRFVDDCLKDAIDKGIEQLVILGAGYDSRAYRFDALKRVKVYEIDHPNTQHLKKQKVELIFDNLPKHVQYVSVDFEIDQLLPSLFGAGYDRELKTLFIWEGVSKYLTKDAVNELLAAVSSNASKGSSIVFDYLFESMVNRSSGSPLARKMLDFQLRKGEPFIFGLPEIAPDEVIKSIGFSKVRNIPASKIKELYFKGIQRARDLHPFWGLIHATI